MVHKYRPILLFPGMLRHKRDKIMGDDLMLSGLVSLQKKTFFRLKVLVKIFSTFNQTNLLTPTFTSFFLFFDKFITIFGGALSM